MKELSIEQKAKAYDEIIKKANKMYSENCEACQMCIEELIPELREESEDEKIRKELIDYINSEYRHTLGLNRKNRFIVWLEKQGEQKPVFEMKTPEESLGIDSDTYSKIVDECIYGEQKIAEWTQDNVEELTEFENVMMHIGNSFFGENAGLDPNDTNTIKEQATILLGLVPKQEWSDEDEDNFKHLLDEIVCLGNNRNSANRLYYDRLIKFIKELKNRAQPKEKWCDKDERMLDRLIAYFEKQVAFTDDDNPRYANWLKSLRPQNRWKPNQTILDSLEIIINHPDRMTDYNKNNLIRLLEQLKKLKG